MTDRGDIKFSLGYSALPKDERKVTALGVMCKFGIIPDLHATTFGMTFGATSGLWVTF